MTVAGAKAPAYVQNVGRPFRVADRTASVSNYRMRTLLTATLVIGLVIPAAGQSRPDLSGSWALEKDRSSQTQKSASTVAVAGLLGDKFTAKQDAKTLTLVISVPMLGREVTAVYNLDGSESKNLNPQGPGMADEPIFSRATWEGDRLVIATRGSTLINGKPLESKRVIWIGSDGTLTIERSSEGQPTTRSVYRRAG